MQDICSNNIILIKWKRNINFKLYLNIFAVHGCGNQNTIVQLNWSDRERKYSIFYYKSVYENNPKMI